MESIRAWLKNNGTYEVGVNLYQHYGNNTYLKKRFAKGPDRFNENKLREELIKLVNKAVDLQKDSWEIPVKNTAANDHYLKDSKAASIAILHAITKTNPETAHVEFGTKLGTVGDQSELNKKYLQLVKKRDRFYIEFNMLMEQKHHLPDGLLLFACARDILSTHQKITETWALIDYYQLHQKFPDEINAEEKPVIDPEKEIQLIRSSISKANARLKNPNCRDRKKTEEKLQSHQERLAVLLKNRNA